MKRTLFEYDKWVKVENSIALFHSLKTIWRQRNFLVLTEELEENDTDNNYQPFLRFSNNEIRANNYVGFIQTANDLVEIYPKVFRHNPDKNKNDMLRHIFFWFNYCSKWKFPFSQAQLDRFSIDEFPELIIAEGETDVVLAYGKVPKNCRIPSTKRHCFQAMKMKCCLECLISLDI